MGKDRDHAPTTTPAAKRDASQADSERDAPAPAEIDRLVAAGDQVKTSWSINYTRRYGKQADGPLQARGPNDALFVHELKVAPDGAPGEADPEPHRFRGVALAKTGASHVGQVAHPKGRAGSASASIGFGGRPKFDFTIKGPAKDVRVAHQQHTKIAHQLADSLDEFVDEAEAQAVLDGILAIKFPGSDITATVKPIMSGGSVRNTTDLRYAQVNGPRSFRLRLAIPSTTKDRNVVSVTGSSGEVQSSHEINSSSGIEDETSVLGEKETKQVNTVERMIEASVNRVAQKVRATDYKNDHSWTDEHASDQTTAQELALHAVIGGSVGLGGFLGKIVKNVVDPKLEGEVDQQLKTTTGVKLSTGGSRGGASVAAFTQSERDDFATYLENTAKVGLALDIREKLTTSIRSKQATNLGAKVGANRKGTESKSQTTTVGRIEVVPTDVNPRLEEEQ